MSETNSIIGPGLKFFFAQMPGIWVCKDKHFVFRQASIDYASLFGFKHPEDMVGKTDFDMPADTVKFAHIFQSEDKKVMQTRKKMKLLSIQPLIEGWKVHLVTKVPMFDDQQNVSGVIFSAIDVTNRSTMEMGHLLSKFSLNDESNHTQGVYSLTSKHASDIHLTKRQSEILFYFLHGKTVKKISILLGISVRTVQEHLDHLKDKFDATNQHDLNDKAIQLGFLNVIPESLFRTQLSLELSDK